MPYEWMNYPYPHYRYYYDYGPYYGRGNGRSDEDIRESIKNNMFWDSWVDSNKVNVGVDNGLVTLTGTVDSWREKRAAGDDAWDTPGVVDVDNDLKVNF
ncbi:MAG TPA: BON domain-containing protein [Thermomicrobiales bacterium]|nr:BON domain-containing protein [Thermomicrobiales bacterium]